VAGLEVPRDTLGYLEQWGRPIAYKYLNGEWPLEMYQTVFATNPRSAEMPSAGRAFTADVIAAIRAKGINFATLTLHTGVSSLEDDEPPYKERFDVPAKTAAAVNAAHAAGHQVIAVGTTVVRALETVADRSGRLAEGRGWTDLFVTPETGVKAIDGLLTGLHEPRSTHLAMLEAIAGRPHLDRAYDAALTGQYLWHEFGDLHLLLPGRRTSVFPSSESVGLPEGGIAPAKSAETR
jgi:S-adenosylmethionine:tRNA ribosyltransferase-isomerase